MMKTFRKVNHVANIGILISLCGMGLFVLAGVYLMWITAFRTR